MIGTQQKGFSFMLNLANDRIFAKDTVTRSFQSVEDVRNLMLNDINHLLNMPKFQVDYLSQRLFADMTNKSSSAWLDRIIEVFGDLSFTCPSNILIDELAQLDKKVLSWLVGGCE